jgi:predicted nucleic acid-binding protein
LISLDAAPIIYYIEAHPDFGPKIRPVLDAVIRGGVTASISSLIHTELLTFPLKTQDAKLVRTYDQLLSKTEYLITQPVTTEIAQTAAMLRATYGLRTPDAIHIASAMSVKAKCFITNDLALQRVAEIRVLTLENLNQLELS